jgi:hypothetical protein
MIPQNLSMFLNAKACHDMGMFMLTRMRRITSLLIPMLLAVTLAGCGDSAKPVPVKDNHAPPPYAGHGMDAVGVGRDPSHHSPFGAPTDADQSGNLQTSRPAASK